MTPSPEEFEAWRENAVTQWVMRGCAAQAEENKAYWESHSWAAGNCDPLLLVELRTRADAYRALFETSYDGWRDANGDKNGQPERA